MHIVGGQQIDAIFVGPGRQRFVNRQQFGNAVFLQLDKEILFAEDIDIPLEALFGFLFFALHQQIGHFGTQTTGGDDQTLGMFGQQIVVDARFVVVTIHLALAGNFEQVAIAGHIFCQQQQMIILTIKLRVAPTHWPAPHRLVGFDADNGLDLALFTGAEEFDGAVHYAVIGQCQRWLTQALGLGHQLLDAAQAVEQRVFGMGVEVDEIVCHKVCSPAQNA
jgi:hypothetical protein